MSSSVRLSIASPVFAHYHTYISQPNHEEGFITCLTHSLTHSSPPPQTLRAPYTIHCQCYSVTYQSHKPWKKPLARHSNAGRRRYSIIQSKFQNSPLDPRRVNGLHRHYRRYWPGFAYLTLGGQPSHHSLTRSLLRHWITHIIPAFPLFLRSLLALSP